MRWIVAVALVAVCGCGASRDENTQVTQGSVNSPVAQPLPKARFTTVGQSLRIDPLKNDKFKRSVIGRSRDDLKRGVDALLQADDILLSLKESGRIAFTRGPQYGHFVSENGNVIQLEEERGFQGYANADDCVEIDKIPDFGTRIPIGTGVIIVNCVLGKTEIDLEAASEMQKKQDESGLESLAFNGRIKIVDGIGKNAKVIGHGKDHFQVSYNGFDGWVAWYQVLE